MSERAAIDSHVGTPAVRFTQVRGPSVARERYKVRIDRCDSFQVACVSGELPIELFVSMLHVLGIESEGGDPSMLMDVRELSTIYSANDLVRVGQEIAVSFLHLERLALLVSPLRRMRISERTARSTGMNMCVFDTEEDAVAWAHRSDQ